MTDSWRQLVDALLERNLVKRRALEDALRRHRPTAETVEKILIDSRLITRQQLLAVKRDLHEHEVVDLEGKIPPLEVMRLLPKAMSERYKAVCHAKKGDELLIAALAPLDAIALDYLRMRSGFEVRVAVGYAGDIAALREMAYAGLVDSPAQLPMHMPEPAMARAVVGMPTPFSTAALNKITPLTEVAPTIGSPRKLSVPGLVRDPHPSQPPPTSTVRHEACPMCKTWSAVLGVRDEKSALAAVMEAAMQRVGAEAISLLLLESDGKSLFFKQALGAGAKDIVDMVVPLEESSVCGWVLANAEPSVVHDARQDPFHNKETDKIIKFVTRDLLAAPVLWDGQVLGVMEAVNKIRGHFDEADLETMRAAAAQASAVLYEARVAQTMNTMLMETVDMLVELLEVHGTVTRAHLMNVAQMSVAIGRNVGLGERDLEHLSYAGLLHDIGMSRIHAGDEREHPGHGAEMLGRIPMLRHLVPYVGFHHERWDGEGTYGLSGESVPLGARILAIAESWCEEQPWEEDGPAMRRYEREFLERFGSAFDPDLREPFERALQGNRTLRSQAQPQSSPNARA